MKTLSIKVSDALHRRLRHRSLATHLTLSQLVHPLLEEAAAPGGRYVYTGQDELFGIAIQIFTLVTELAGERSPRLIERAAYEARRLMQDRGLLDVDLGSGEGDADGEHDDPEEAA